MIPERISKNREYYPAADRIKPHSGFPFSFASTPTCESGLFTFDPSGSGGAMFFSGKEQKMNLQTPVGSINVPFIHVGDGKVHNPSYPEGRKCD